MAQDETAIDRLRMSDSDRRKLLDLIERKAIIEAAKQTNPSDKNSDRRSIRVRVDMPNIHVDITQPSGSHAKFSVIPRNLSAGGMSFVHGQYLHQGTRCSITLPTLDGEQIYLNANAILCRHITGVIHEIGVQFDETIDLRMFCKLTPEQSKRVRAEQAASNTSGDMTTDTLGEALIVDDFEMDRNLIGMWLQHLGLIPSMAGNKSEAIDAIEEAEFDVVLMDMWLGKESGCDITKELRSRGFKGPIIASSAEEDEAMKNKAYEAGCNGYLVKPFNEAKLRAALEEVLPIQLAGGDSEKELEPIVSEFAEDTAMAPLIASFIQGLEDTTNRLQKAKLDQDISALETICRTMKGAGTSYGFEPLTDVAVLALEAVSAEEDHLTEKAMASIRELNDILKRIQIVAPATDLA